MLQFADDALPERHRTWAAKRQRPIRTLPKPCVPGPQGFVRSW